MKRVLYIQNDDDDPPALLATVLNELGVAVDVIHTWKGEAVPATVDHWDGVVVGGGGMSVYQKAEYPFLVDEEALILEARRRKKPLLGMCLGAQLMASAFGGKVYQNHAKEIGFFEVRFTPEARRDPLWQGYTETPFAPAQWHGDTFTLPPEAVLLASSEITPHQLFRLDQNLYAFQFHLEFDLPSLIGMVEGDDSGYLPSNGVDPQAFLEKAHTALPRVEPLARAVFTRWTQMLG